MALNALIAGAGPVGLTMAIELARYGVSVRLIDQAAQRSDKSKALVLWSRTVELLGLSGCAQSFLEAGNKVFDIKINSGARRIAQVSFRGLESPYPFALMLPQSDTERLLETCLASFGVAVERQVELLGFQQDAAEVRSRVRHADGREEEITSDWLIGCDGAHSTTRHILGSDFEGDTLPSHFLLADVHASGLPSPSEVSVYWHHDGTVVFFPITSGRYRVIADTAPIENAADPSLEEVQAMVNQRGPQGIVLSDPIWLSRFRINERKVRDYRSGRVFLAGDAAHVHSPAGGQGMNTGMQDAFNLAWKLALVCQGACAPEPLLSSYSAERSAVGKRVLSEAGKMTVLATMRNRAAQTVRDAIAGYALRFERVQQAIAANLAEIAVSYRPSPLNGQSVRGLDGPAPGQRINPDSTPSLIGACHSPRFALFAPDGDPARRLIGEFGELLENATRSPLRPGGIWLARPDGYVAAVAREGDFASIASYLAALRQGA